MLNILFLCTGNSARSVLGEAILNDMGKNKFKGFSAGSKPVGKVNPFAIKQLESQSITGKYSSKSWDVFSEGNAENIDLVITVCDNAAGEVCPTFNGAPVTVHWGLKDPAGVADEAEAFKKTYAELKTRLEKLVALDFNVSPATVKEQCQEIHSSLN